MLRRVVLKNTVQALASVIFIYSTHVLIIVHCIFHVLVLLQFPERFHVNFAPVFVVFWFLSKFEWSKGACLQALLFGILL